MSYPGAVTARHLLLLRHAHAVRDAASGRDHDRELSPRGRRDAAAMGRFVTAIERTPGVVLTSPAARARATAELALEAGGWGCPLHEIAAIYEGTAEDVIEVVRAHGGDHRTILLVGHGPTWPELASALLGGGELRLPKASLAHFELELEAWGELEPGGAVLRTLVTPALLPGLAAGRDG